MRIGIIGAGFTGLAAGYYLSKKGHNVSIFETENTPGGLAIGYKRRLWDWSLERHYHHWFTNDKSVLRLAAEIGHSVEIRRPKTSTYVEGEIYRFDSPRDVLLFPKLSVLERLRMAATLAVLRYDPFWQPLEKFNAASVLPKAMGKKTYDMIWKPLFHNKFGSHADNISLAWFWARIVKRTPFLAYPEGGFLSFAQALQKKIEKKGGKFYFDTEVTNLSVGVDPIIKFRKRKKLTVETEEFNNVIVTLPSAIFIKISPQLPDQYKDSFVKLKSLGATNLVLRLKKPFLTDGTYWLNVCDPSSPIMAVVEHTNFMDRSHYNNEHLVYLGNYLPSDHSQFIMNKEEKLKLFRPFLEKINPDYERHLLGYELFKAPFAQPIIPTNYSRYIPPHTTPFRNVFLANIEQVYPWDRGTNYAVELGKKIADIIS
jgi:protoporphyrinogen oxidase